MPGWIKRDNGVVGELPLRVGKFPMETQELNAMILDIRRWIERSNGLSNGLSNG